MAVMGHRQLSMVVTWQPSVVVKMLMCHDVAAVVGGDMHAWCSIMSSFCLAQMGTRRGTQRQWQWWVD